ncbi:MAG TPA: helix-turn-helix domain-containing protein [Pyrinomonadaceae bacterium]|nr:helix-turn-helix domain-containing protein [Pyrinomonadaceae bacterium]
MGKYPRQKQVRLPAKLLKIRTALGLSQNEMLRQLKLEGKLSRTNISNYETGDREPPLHVLLRYGQTAGICLDVIVDDELDLPARLPTVAKHTKLKTKRAIKKRR